MIDPARPHCTITVVDREDKALQRCTLSARSMPGDGQEHRLRPVLLPSHSSSGRKAKNLLNWGEAPTQVNAKKYPRAVGHMSTLVVLCPPTDPLLPIVVRAVLERVDDSGVSALLSSLDLAGDRLEPLGAGPILVCEDMGIERRFHRSPQPPARMNCRQTLA